jgi:phage gp29-like protein
MPWKIAKYNSYDPQARQDLEKALEEAGGNANIVIPEGTEIDLKYGTASGNGDLYDKLKNACNEQLSVLILGQTMTTNDTRGSGYAQGKIHEAVEQEIHLNDRRYITRILNDQFNPILEMHGFKVSGGKWSYREEDNIELKKTKIGIDMQVAEKVPVADDYFYETYGIPKPENYDELKARQEAARTAPASLAQDPDPALEQNDKKKQDPKLSAKQGLLERVLSFFS